MALRNAFENVATESKQLSQEEVLNGMLMVLSAMEEFSGSPFENMQ